jgi:diguanylate cyclase (GGDEF)-like protein/PAS domain S-box-containing protein
VSNYAFNWFALPLILTALSSLVVGALVLRRERMSPVGGALFLVTVTISVWLGASAAAYCSTDPVTGLFWTQVAYIGVPLFPATLSLYVLVALRQFQHLRVLIWTAMGVAVAFVALANKTELLISGVEKQWWGYYPTYGAAGFWFMGYYAAMIVFGIVLLSAKLRQAPKGSTSRRRIGMSLLALLVISLAAVDFPAKYGVSLYPFGYVAVLAFLCVIFLLERRHRIVYMTPAFAAKQILATMQGAVLVTDLDGMVEMSNHAACGLLGYTRAELLELSLNDVFASSADWRDLMVGCVEGEGIRQRETRWKPRDRDPIDVNVSVSLLHDRTGRSLGAVFVALDITDRKLWERALATEKEHLARLNEAAVAISHCLTASDVQRVGILMACKTTCCDGGLIVPFPLAPRSSISGSEGLTRRNRSQLKRIVRTSPAVERAVTGRTSVRLTESEVAQAGSGDEAFTGAVVVPVVLRGEVLSLLCLGTKKSRAAFTEAELALANSLAALIGVALENARLYDDAKFLSQRDPVTGLLNHRGINALLEKEQARSERSGGNFAVVMMDLDNFKLFNDTYGHASGDQVLQDVAAILEKAVRRGDFVGRYGGDEFLALLPETDARNALKTIERVKQTLDEFAWCPDGESEVPLRMSYGVATYPFEGRHVGELLAAADANMYLSKGQGGNCVTSGDIAEGRLGDSTGIFTVLDGLVTAVDGKDHYTRKHSGDVSDRAVALAAELGLPAETVRCLRIAGLLHDVGKIGIPDRILRKPGGLNEDEYDIVKQHVSLGELIINEIPNLLDVLAAVGSHHERYDGQGYPRGLSGEDIPILGRILAVADAYSAMTTGRSYRKALTPAEARDELKRVSGTQLDPQVVDAFLAILDRPAIDDLDQDAMSESVA